MKLDDKQYKRVAEPLPKQRENVKTDNRTLPDTLVYRCKNGRSWRGPPEDFGNRHVIYTRFSSWAKNGVLERVYAALCEEGLQNASAYALDSTPVKVHPDAFGCLKKRQTVHR